jgi:putative membrane protein insertion efficiency factor
MAGFAGPWFIKMAGFAGPRPIGATLAMLVRAYQLLVRPILPPACRFEPSCSAYAIEALQRHGAFRGTLLAAWRILRCNPWGASGHDPVPPCARGTASPCGHKSLKDAKAS